MDRLVAWYRLGSSVGAVVALIVANAIPLIGVLFFGWNVWNILIVYWLENGIVGVFNVLKMARAEGPAVTGLTINGRPATGTAKVALIPFFIVHYGIFWFVHGVFVLTLPLSTGIFSDGFAPLGEPGGGTDITFEDGGVATIVPSGELSAGIDPGLILFAVVALALSHGLSYWWNFLRGGEYRRVSAVALMFAPYGRLVALHVTIILGAMAVIVTGAPAAAVAILVALKTLLDVGFHLAEHRKAAVGTIIID